MLSGNSSSPRSPGRAISQFIARRSRILELASREGKKADVYKVVGVERDVKGQEVKKRYWRLSLLIHPDKCDHPRAQDAFNAVSQAAKDLQVAFGTWSPPPSSAIFLPPCPALRTMWTCQKGRIDGQSWLSPSLIGVPIDSQYEIAKGGIPKCRSRSLPSSSSYLCSYGEVALTPACTAHTGRREEGGHRQGLGAAAAG